MSITYLLPRLVRHFMPEKITRALLLRGLIIRPGLETRSPIEAALRYQRDLQEAGVSIEGKRVLVFGYGGRFNLGCQLLELGAAHVTLCEYSVTPDEAANQSLLPEFDKYLVHLNGKTITRPEWFTLMEGDIRELAKNRGIRKADIVCSTSVFEHLIDPAGVLAALAQITQPQGIHLHYIDLRDHFFRFPFEMLTFATNTWKNWLNPTSNLNRWRMTSYSDIFTHLFTYVDIHVTERDLIAWKKISERILPEFKTGDLQLDAVTQIRVIATGIKNLGEH
jgi:SAM-dependent methyltransferase